MSSFALDHVIEREYVRRKRFVEAQEQVKHVRIGETQIHKKCKVYKARGQIKAMGTKARKESTREL